MHGKKFNLKLHFALNAFKLMSNYCKMWNSNDLKDRTNIYRLKIIHKERVIRRIYEDNDGK